jgi:mono/diheme cytochrome c family protein
MKKIIALIAFAGAAFLVLQAFLLKPAPGTGLKEDGRAILESTCYDCHSNAAKGKLSKSALNLEKWDDYSVTRKIAKLGDICEMLEKGKMPPEKYLESHPEKVLSEEQKETVCQWTKAESEKLMEDN